MCKTMNGNLSKQNSYPPYKNINDGYKSPSFIKTTPPNEDLNVHHRKAI